MTKQSAFLCTLYVLKIIAFCTVYWNLKKLFVRNSEKTAHRKLRSFSVHCSVLHLLASPLLLITLQQNLRPWHMQKNFYSVLGTEFSVIAHLSSKQMNTERINIFGRILPYLFKFSSGKPCYGILPLHLTSYLFLEY